MTWTKQYCFAFAALVAVTSLIPFELKAHTTQGAASAAATSAFSKLGLKPELVSKAIPVLTSFVTKSGGASVGSLLAGALK